nr:glucose-6-phosphate/phosphate translocator 1, chloroplastic [Ipomoea trifida]
MGSTEANTTEDFSNICFFRSKPPVPAPKLCVLPPLQTLKPCRSSVLSLAKSLHVSSVETFGILKERSRGDNHEKRALVTYKAYEADRSQPIEEPAAKSEAARKVKIRI